MIKIKSDDGFVARVDPEKVSAFGIEPATRERFFVVCADRQYVISKNPRAVMQKFEKHFKNGSCVAGFKRGPTELGGSR